jgi:hypothetical protein
MNRKRPSQIKSLVRSSKRQIRVGYNAPKIIDVYDTLALESELDLSDEPLLQVAGPKTAGPSLPK